MAKRKILIYCSLILVFIALLSYFSKDSGAVSQHEKRIGNPFALTDVFNDERYKAASDLNAGWVRPEISWHKVEVKDDIYKLEELEGGFTRLNNKYGLSYIISLRTKGDWATKHDLSLCKFKKDRKIRGCPDPYASCPPKDLQDNPTQYGYSRLYYDFVYNLVSHFKGKIEYLIIENEVNTMTFWHGTAEDYLKLRATAYKAAHDANPNVVVVDNGIAYEALVAAIVKDFYCSGRVEDAKRFFRSVSKRQLPQKEIDDYILNVSNYINCNEKSRSYSIIEAVFSEPTFDMMSYHYYGPWQEQETVIRWVRSEMLKNGYEKPIINTEGGYIDKLRSSDDPGLQRDVADDIPKLHVMAFENGVKMWTWLALLPKSDPKYKELISQDLKKRPAYYSYRTTAAKLKGFSSVEKLNYEAGIYVYKFLFDNGREAYVLWSEKNTVIDFDEIENGVVTDIFGKSRPQERKIALTKSPLFVENLAVEVRSPDLDYESSVPETKKRPVKGFFRRILRKRF